jgi:DNA mismatch repair protein MutL
MGIITELSQHVSNQIAAGEVVERPCSVIKELVENALDAGSKTIEVRIKSGGFDHIVVQDDGVGMDEADLRLCLKRYATSKLSSVSDLDRLHTFGFRGEALPSIAAVSRLSIVSRPQNEAHGLKVVVDGGIINELIKSGAGFGTRIEVRELFYNVPARLKFVRSKRVETAEIERMLKAYAFINHDIAWSFFADESMVFSCGHDIGQSQRAVVLLGHDTEGYLYDWHAKTDLLDIKGVLGAPAISRRDYRGMVTFVNDRLVSDKKLTMAIKTAFRTVLEVGYQPVCAINIHMAPDEIDVNVHPRKTEVRFRDERRVLAHIISKINDFLISTPWLTKKSPAMAHHYQPEHFGGNNFHALISGLEPQTYQTPAVISHGFSLPLEQHVQKPLLSAKKFADLRVIGQVMATYLVAESEDGLVLVDQHAAHERVMFEKIKKEQGNVLPAPLLIPISINLSSSEMALFLEHEADFQALGIEAEAFGDSCIILRSLPDFLHKADVDRLIKEMLSDLARYGFSYAQGNIFDHVCATLACHASIRAGQRLSKEEIAALLIELDDTDFGAHCPHGRPIVKSFLKPEVKTWFDRT